MKIKTIQDIKNAFISKTNNQIINFNVVNKNGKVKPVEVVIKYHKGIDEDNEEHYYYRIYFKKESVAYTRTRRKKEALEFIIEEARRLGLKDKLKDNIIDNGLELKFDANLGKKITYKECKNFTKDFDFFYSSTQEIIDNDKTYEIESFSYRNATWSDFQDNENKKELRGISFIKEKNSKDEFKFFTIGYHKFFNYGEGNGENSTMEQLNKHKIANVVDKLDGSLLMFGLLPSGKVIAKSKTSISSEHAKLANKIINEDKKLYDFIKSLLLEGKYPIFELVGPTFRIVIDYEIDKLVLLGIRDENLNYIKFEKVKKIHNKEIKHVSIAKEFKFNLKELLELKETESDYEGFIIELENQERVKIKLNSYLALHTVKDNINNRKKLIKLAINEDLDDLRGLFIEDKSSLKIINDTEQEVFDFLNKTIKIVEEEHSKDKHLSIKDYAIKNKNKSHFPLLMQIYKGFDVSYKDYAFNYLTQK